MIQLGNSDIVQLTAFRRELHRFPEVSGQEEATARRVVAALRGTGPDRIVTGLGGHGVAAVYEGTSEGPSVLVRCELDALPIEELSAAAHRSTVPGTGHLCGHDGHMAVLMGVARVLGRSRPEHGRIVLLFQPAEEDGSGAAKVLADPQFEALRSDYALSLHNMPGMPLGQVALAAGPMNCASRGALIRLRGRTAHASMPETGLSPMVALSRLMPALTALGQGSGPSDPGFRLVTVTHARLGEPAFGIAPGEAELWATLRTTRDEDMAALVAAVEELVLEMGAGLVPEIGYHDVFRACGNHPEATDILARALTAEGVSWDAGDLPMRASEDFGRFGDVSKSAMFLLGAGEETPALHNPDYDFPDELIPLGAGIFLAALAQVPGIGGFKPV
ncbi:amidohydrolase [Seohaeicola zhoushanensis]|uniref:Amidohydrolase n=1 Tax=Seohaeicola zhoushanensis TaxID=1569283 RepID=A0A8J3GZ38_9RHOB|nr:amidohydrolase [Seohaeicola zhoushanensis]GHF59377.1 amidohydrolase [Seohaeicola zhoushanensis]